MRGARLVFVLLWLGSPAVYGDEPTARWVLPPSVGPTLEARLRALEPAWRADTIAVDRDHVRLELCPSGGAPCAALRLDAPRPDCPGTATREWCVTGADSTLVGRVAAALADPEAAPVDGRPTWMAVPVEPRPWGPRLLAYGGALVQVLLPLLLGWGLGALGRRVVPGPGSRLLRLAVAAAPVALAAVLALASVVDAGAWDLVLPGLLAGAGLWWGSRPERPARRTGGAVRTLASAALVVAVVEGGARLVPAASTGFPPPEAAAWRLSSLPQGQACRLVGPSFEALTDERLARVDASRPLVLHLGDSMVEGAGVPPEHAFPARLGEIDATYAHVNGGLWGTGPDAYLVGLQRWLSRIHPTLVLVHVFLANDVQDLDAPQPCCHDRPLLTYGADGAVPGCDLDGPQARPWRPGGSPPPYALRVLTEVSAAARLACLAIAAPSAGAGRDDDELRWRHLAAVLHGLRRQADGAGVPLGVVVVPERLELERVAGNEIVAPARRARFVALAREAGLAVLDPSADFVREARERGVLRLFVQGSGRDVHLSAEGHDVYARWLRERITSLR